MTRRKVHTSMRFSTLIYTIKQGIANIFRNKWYSLASMATISACLLMFGVFYAIVANFQYMVKAAQEGVAVTVFFDEDISQERMMEIGDLIEKRSEVSRVNFVSADEAWESFKEDYLGEYVDGFGDDNPIKGSDNYEVYLRDVSMQDNLVTYLESLDGVRDVNYSAITANTLSGMNKLIGYVSMGIILILLAVSVFLISNTVTIGISVRKDEIGIMKYIGATDFFVRAPFVIEGMLIGAFGSLVPLAILYFLYNNIVEYVEGRFPMLSQLLKFMTADQIFATLIPISLAIGIGIGFLGSFSTVRKHIRV